MRKYTDLSETEREQAHNKCLCDLLRAIIEGAVRFDDGKNADSLQARIDTAIRNADAAHTPWFAAEHVMDAAGDTIGGMAQSDAEDALYPDPFEIMVRL